ncbi:guanylate kinase [Ruminiclostridium sufflavum DSM 19573]|uniref:Guanylate kinase n=1 Tax=Ruminiclostridium sufflavum DSM 19573 TaxID=1121337 RepID=A0A318Y6I1_9FIRM|nr:guanylate kinase [Ruminiclostridium sufflavum]PYG87631.1 guanylate kinase [Ruminiclostridium sufflavum DSM 19573]
MQQKGLLVVVSGPSGTGKGTVCQRLLSKRSTAKYSVSATTRKPREGEVEGKNYFFVSESKFLDMIDNNDLIEWDKYCDNYYGTPKSYVEACIKEGLDVILEITVAGALEIKQKYPDCVLVFIIPPSFEELERRIVCRGTEGCDVIGKRLEQASREMKYASKYDYLVLNDSVDNAVSDIERILDSERLKPSRNEDLLSSLLKA